jgi:hypothetical protein
MPFACFAAFGALGSVCKPSERLFRAGGLIGRSFRALGGSNINCPGEESDPFSGPYRSLLRAPHQSGDETIIPPGMGAGARFISTEIGSMPASRSRTDRWIDCLHQIYERNGGLEISLARPGETGEPDEGGVDLVWRVRILRLTDTDIVVERPAAMGHTFSFTPDASIVAVMNVGQNRWMFRTVVLKPDGGSHAFGLRLAMPKDVERCRRRDFLRVSTASLRLPDVCCWPLLDPASVVGAEVANRALIMDLQNAGSRGSATRGKPDAPELLPEVAPPFSAHLMNVGGGGVGLLVSKGETSALDRANLLWMAVNFQPHIPAPLAMTARVVHTHLDSEQNVYVGAAFDFSFHAAHRDFVVSQITRYINALSPKRLAA